jgi:hypothetical protein
VFSDDSVVDLGDFCVVPHVFCSFWVDLARAGLGSAWFMLSKAGCRPGPGSSWERCLVRFVRAVRKQLRKRAFCVEISRALGRI